MAATARVHAGRRLDLEAELLDDEVDTTTTTTTTISTSGSSRSSDDTFPPHISADEFQHIFESQHSKLRCPLDAVGQFRSKLSRRRRRSSIDLTAEYERRRLLLDAEVTRRYGFVPRLKTPRKGVLDLKKILARERVQLRRQLCIETRMDQMGMNSMLLPQDEQLDFKWLDDDFHVTEMRELRETYENGKPKRMGSEDPVNIPKRERMSIAWECGSMELDAFV